MADYMQDRIRAREKLSREEDAARWLRAQEARVVKIAATSNARDFDTTFLTRIPNEEFDIYESDIAEVEEVEEENTYTDMDERDLTVLPSEFHFDIDSHKNDIENEKEALHKSSRWQRSQRHTTYDLGGPKRFVEM